MKKKFELWNFHKNNIIFVIDVFVVNATDMLICESFLVKKIHSFYLNKGKLQRNKVVNTNKFAVILWSSPISWPPHHSTICTEYQAIHTLEKHTREVVNLLPKIISLSIFFLHYYLLLPIHLRIYSLQQESNREWHSKLSHFCKKNTGFISKCIFSASVDDL